MNDNDEQEQKQQRRQIAYTLAVKMAKQGYGNQGNDWWIYIEDEEHTPYEEYEVMVEVNDPYVSIGVMAEIMSMTNEQLAARVQERATSPYQLRLRLESALGYLGNILLSQERSLSPREERMLKKLQQILEGREEGEA